MKKYIKILVIFIVVVLLVIIGRYIFRYITMYRNSNSSIYTQGSYTDKINNKYSDFIKFGEEDFTIPGVQEGTIAQGLCYVESDNIFLVSAYHKGNAYSVLYAIDKESGELKHTYILDEFMGHVGGISYYNDVLYIASESSLYSINYDFIRDNLNDTGISTVVMYKIMDTEVKADYITVYNNYLIIGEYDNYPKYKTDNSHHSDDNKFKSIALFYDLENNYEIVKKIYMPNKVQGITFLDDTHFIASSSFWFMEDSHISLYTIEDNSNNDIYYVNKEKDLSIPPMSEGITVLDNNLYVIFESSAKLYSFYTKNKLYNAYKIDLDYFN